MAEENRTLEEPLVQLSNVEAGDKNQEESQSTKSFGCSRVMWLLRILYFLAGISGTSWARFSAVFYLSIGLSPFQIGMIEGSMPITGAAFGLLWAIVADKTRKRKVVWIVTRCCSTCVLMLMLILPLCNIKLTFSSVLAISIGQTAFTSGGLLDGFAMSSLDGNTERYGEVRMWMAISYGLGSLVMGFVTDSFNGNFAPNFLIYFGFTATFVVVNIWQVPNQTKDEKEIKASDLHIRDFACAMVKPKSLFFWTECFLFGIGVTLVERLLFVFLQKELGASTTLCGLVVGVTVIFEIPIFHFSKWLLRNVGFDVLMFSAQTAYVVRVIGYTWLTKETVWWVLACEILHGFTFATFWISAVQRAKQLSPPGWTSSGQTLLLGMYYGLSCAVGAPVGGWIMQQYGGKQLYRGAGMMVAAVMGVHLTKFYADTWCTRRKQNQKEIAMK